MNEMILLVMMGGLALIELGLIVSIWKLTSVLERMSLVANSLNTRFSGVSYSLDKIQHTIKKFGTGKIAVNGKNPFTGSNMELELDLNKKFGV